MNFWKLLIGRLGLPIIATGTVGLFHLVQAQRVQAQSNQPDLLLKVGRLSGVCPEAVGLWVMPLSMVGAVEYTVVANTLPFTQPGSLKLINSDKKSVTYGAPLNERYASCTGQAESEQPRSYAVRFQEGKVIFRVELKPDDLNSDINTYTKIGYASVVTGRPYLIWRESQEP